jgi:hypothetical protein
MTKAEPKAKRSGQKTLPVAVFNGHAEKLKLTPRELATHCGYHNTAWHTWNHSGKAPEVACLAAEALVRRQSGAASAPKLWLANCPHDKREAFTQFCAALGIALVEVPHG